jgi:hypothetical protein
MLLLNSIKLQDENSIHLYDSLLKCLHYFYEINQLFGYSLSMPHNVHNKIHQHPYYLTIPVLEHLSVFTSKEIPI